VTRIDFDAVIGRLAEAPSLVSTDRICLAYTAGGRVPDVDRSVGCELRWRGSVVPWWLAPLRFIAAANRTLFEITEARELPTFVGATDSCFTVEVYSCPRPLLPIVVQHLRQAGVMASPGEVIDQDPAYFELKIDCDGGSHESWLLRSRHGSACPEDLAAIAHWADEEGGQADFVSTSLSQPSVSDQPVCSQSPRALVTLVQTTDDDTGDIGRGDPAWLAPIAGAIVVALAGVWTASEMGEPITLVWVSGWAGAGVLIGCLVAILDRPGPGTLISRFLAVISPIAALLPIVGVAFGVAAYASNRHHPGPYRTLSRIAVAESVVVSVFYAVVLLAYGTSGGL